MDEIRKNIIAIWKGLSLARRVSLIASLVFSLSVLSGVVYLASQPRLTLLYGNVSPAEAGKIIEYLDSKKIVYEVSDAGRNIMVPAQQVYTIRMGLASAGIPTLSEAGGGVGFELFDKPSFGMSDFMQKANYYRALEGELSRSIRQLEEVSNARVLIVVPEDELFGQTHREAKASVMIQLQPGKSMSQDQVRAIQFLVANGVENLQADRVAVVDNTGKTLAADSPADGANGLSSDKQRQQRAELEMYLQDKAQSLLDQVLGPGQAVVRVAAEIDYSQVQQTSEKYDPKNTAIQTETVNSETNTTHAQDSNSGAGATANTATGGTTDGKISDQKRDNTTNQYAVGKVIENRVEGAGSIKRLTVALMLNQRHQVAGTKPLPRTPTEIQSLQNIVEAAVGFEQTDARQDVIQTQETAFADLFGDSAAPAVAKSNVTSEIGGYLPYVTQGCLVAFALGIILYFRSLLSPKKKGSSPDSFETLLQNYEKSSSNGNGNGSHNGQNGKTNGAPARHGILTPDELAKLIRENPNNTSQAFKQWLKRN